MKDSFILSSDAYELISFKLGMMLDATKFYSSIQFEYLLPSLRVTGLRKKTTNNNKQTNNNNNNNKNPTCAITLLLCGMK